MPMKSCVVMMVLKTANATYFRSLVGGLNHLSHTKPDIAFSVGIVSRFMHNPSKLHLGATKRIFKYVAGTTEHGIWYSKLSNFRLYGFTDSDWQEASTIERAQQVISSTLVLEQFRVVQRNKWWPCQAHIAATSSACQAIWLRKLLLNQGGVLESD